MFVPRRPGMPGRHDRAFHLHLPGRESCWGCPRCGHEDVDVIERIATVPGTPLLIPDIASGAADELGEVRRAALGRVAWAAGDSGRIIVLAQDPSASAMTRTHLPNCVSLTPLGLNADLASAGEHSRAAPDNSRVSHEDSRAVMDGDDAEALPVSVLVAAYLASAASVVIEDVWTVPSNPNLVDVPPDIAAGAGIVLIADGSSTRSPKAPGSFVEGAVEFDDALVEAVASIDREFLTDSKREHDADRFGVQGLGVWAAAAHLTGELAGDWIGEVDLSTDPYGVCYLVAGWTASHP